MEISDAETIQAAQRCIEPDCARLYGLRDKLLVCPHCGGLLEIVKRVNHAAQELKEMWRARRASNAPRDRSGVWRFRELLPFDEDAPIITLTEGNTPLYDAPRAARFCGLERLELKHQGCNPTGSFKDTGMTVAITQAVRLGARTAICASTGNTAASLAAYAARAGLGCAILVPRGQISLAKLAQTLDYGALVFEVEGNFDDCMRLIQELAAEETVYVVNSINPFRLEGQKTVAIELLEQLDWQVPDHVVLPGGNLGNSSALGKGFFELLALGLIARVPRISVVQAEGAAPFARLFARSQTDERVELVPIAAPQTLATAIKIGAPVSWKKALEVVRRTGGQVISVSEREIAEAKAIIGRDGIGCEPASAAAVAGIKRLVETGLIARASSVIAVLTGHFLKDSDYAINYHRGTLRAPGDKELEGAHRNLPISVPANKAEILARLDHQTNRDDHEHHFWF